MAENDKTGLTGDINIKPKPAGEEGELAGTVHVSQADIKALQSTPTKAALQRSATDRTDDLALWTAIRNRTDAIGFNRYNEFIDRVLCQDPLPGDEAISEYGLPTIADRRTTL